MNFEEKTLELLKSWETGYIPPSAQMVIKDARLLLEEKLEEIERLKEIVEELKKNQRVVKKKAKEDV